MSMRYKGGFISKTPPTVTTSSAQGMWTLSQQAQYQKAGVWPLNPNVPTGGVGSAFGGGYYAGKIAVGGGGVATHYLVIAPKSSENSSSMFGSYPSAVVATSLIDGPANTAALVALGSTDYQAAIVCNNLNAGAGLNGYKDWYLPAKNELEVLYYFLKPSANANNTASGSNANAVSPEPVSQNYTSGSPAQTSVAIFQAGGAQALAYDQYTPPFYWSSTQLDAYQASRQQSNTGYQFGNDTYVSNYVRAVRRVPI